MIAWKGQHELQRADGHRHVLHLVQGLPSVDIPLRDHSADGIALRHIIAELGQAVFRGRRPIGQGIPGGVPGGLGVGLGAQVHPLRVRVLQQRQNLLGVGGAQQALIQLRHLADGAGRGFPGLVPVRQFHHQRGHQNQRRQNQGGGRPISSDVFHGCTSSWGGPAFSGASWAAKPASVPSPGRLAKARGEPCSAAMRLHSASPSPAPPWLRARDLSTI